MIDIFKKKSKDMILGPSIKDGQYLIYLNDLGIGYLKDCSEPGQVYNENYFNKYVGYKNSEIANNLNIARIKYTQESTEYCLSVCDIGIGSGDFVLKYGCHGTDINPFAIEFLKEHGALGNLENGYNYLTFWDSLEHIEDPSYILSCARDGVLISMPIYSGFDDILASKHFRPNEHIWYFTDEGLKTFMKEFGFEFVNSNDIETKVGRESIKSYFFKRK